MKEQNKAEDPDGVVFGQLTKVPPDAGDVTAAKLRKVLSFNLRMARLSVRMTQRELSKASGISQKHISLIELVGANIGIDVLAALAAALPGITPADLLTPPPRD